MLSFSTRVSVVQTIPTGLLKAIYICSLSFLFISFPLTVSTSPEKTFVPISGILPLILTAPASMSLSASLLEQNPASLRYLLIRTDCFSDIKLSNALGLFLIACFILNKLL